MTVVQRIIAGLVSDDPRRRERAAREIDAMPERERARVREALGSFRAARLAPEQHRELATRFGRDPDGSRGPHFEGNDFVLPVLSKDQAREVLRRHEALYGASAAPSAGVSGDVRSLCARAARGGR
jgi:hypothetical protein